MSSNYVEKITWLPTPPNELVDSLQDIPLTQKNCHLDTSYSHIYASYTTNSNLEEYFQQFFDYDIACRYQIINGALRPHVDDGLENQWKYNYLFDTGGYVETLFWSNVQSSAELLHTEVCEQNQWYKLNVSCPHSITHPQNTRFSLVIRRK